VQSAVEEFKMQGYDMSCVIKKAGGGDTSRWGLAAAWGQRGAFAAAAGCRTCASGGPPRHPVRAPPCSHPIAVTTKALAGCDASTEAAQLASLLQGLQQALAAQQKEGLQEAHAVALKEGTVAALLACCSQLQAARASAELVQALKVLQQLMAAETLRGAFTSGQGAVAVKVVLRAELDAGDMHWPTAHAAATLAEAASFKDEENKCT
jgi:hypothetical protein